MEDFRLVPILGFTVDTSLALLRFAFDGVLDRFPDLKLVVAHSGGVFPFIRGRVEKALKLIQSAGRRFTSHHLPI
jgi:predicted TIM-barrel fold metal-dependent hydrolase